MQVKSLPPSQSQTSARIFTEEEEDEKTLHKALLKYLKTF